MLKINYIKHYKECIRSKGKLRDYYEKRGNDEACEVLDREILRMTGKLIALGGRP